jgi:hypothetical protein
MNTKGNIKSVPLPNLPITWVDVYTEGILLPGHICIPSFDPRSLQNIQHLIRWRHL